ncbi:hypothetical protein [Cryobacterium luteum]|uniref:Uncharacterized protein n=2 Tax=Cryobacterium luteum TaxID=1424661 RepID=A0A1H8GPS6_9MICO|nr:hypothetical protein [Cryobacterium luteum]TFB84648.1 hypothetical protein E3O10_16145 [Cryobacterium luteum]SEN45288.1 competence protein ComEC [Cryobacterium luteum]
MNLDLRLMLPALAVWLTAGVLIAVPAGAGMVAVTLWLVAGACTALLVVRRMPRRRQWPTAPPAARWQKLGGSIVLCCAGAALAATAVGVWAPVRLPPEVRTAAAAHATVTATVTVWSVPVAAKAFIGSGTSGRVRYRATLTEIDSRGETTRVSSPIVVFAEAAGDGTEPEIGTTLAVRGTLRMTEPGDATVALLFATGPAPNTEANSVTPPPWWLHWANDLRARFTTAATNLSGDGGDLLPGLAIGDTSSVSPTLDSAMKTSSLSHLTAVSGDTASNRDGLH